MTRKPSTLELQFDAQLREAGILGYVTEYQFCTRKWRFDFAWKGPRVAAEIEGGVWSQGRHSRGGGFISDCDKYNTAQLMGYRVFRFTAKHLNDLSALATIRTALGRGNV